MHRRSRQPQCRTQHRYWFHPSTCAGLSSKKRSRWGESSREIIEPSRVSHSCPTGDGCDQTTISKRKSPASAESKGETMGGFVLQRGKEAPVPYAARRWQHDQARGGDGARRVYAHHQRLQPARHGWIAARPAARIHRAEVPGVPAKEVEGVHGWDVREPHSAPYRSEE